LRLADLGKFERPAQVGPSATAIDNSLDPEPRVDILPRIISDRGGCLRVKVAGRNLSEQRSGSQQFHKRSPTGILGTHLRRLLNSLIQNRLIQNSLVHGICAKFAAVR
jgi:hypothetical protein